MKTRYKPIIRMRGNQTAKAIYRFLGFSQTVDQTILVNSEYSATDNFATFITSSIECTKCGKPMMLAKNRRGRFYLRCSGRGKCDGTEFVTVDIVDRYLYRHKKGSIRCPRDNTSLEAGLGRNGIYVRCCGVEKHFIGLDEI